MQAELGILVLLCAVAGSLGEEERPPPASVLIKECKDSFLSPCPFFDRAIKCLKNKQIDVKKFADEVKAIQAEIDQLNAVERETDVCPGLTSEGTCYQEFYNDAVNLFEQSRRRGDGLPVGCPYLSEALTKLTELHEFCPTDMPKMSASDRIREYTGLKNAHC